MQQENAGLPEAQRREENLNKLLTKVEKLGYAEVKPQVKEAFEQRLVEFTANTSKTFGEKVMDVGLVFGEGKNKDGNIYLNAQEALLVRPVNVPHDTIEGRKTEVIEDLLQFLPKNEQGMIDSKAIAPQDEGYVLEMQAAMQWAMEKAPHVFNSLMVKYQPELVFAVPADMLAQQEKLINDLTPYNKVSSYFNLTALEMFNAMEGRFPLKNLFKTKEMPAQSASNASTQSNSERQFQAYVKFDFSKRNVDGTYPVELVPANRLQVGKGMLDYNWEEMQSRQNRGDIIHYLEKGCAVELTNANKTGEKKVLVSTNPEYGTFDLRKTSGAIIYNQKDYLRNPLAIEVGAVVSLKKDTGEKPSQTVHIKEATPVDQVANRLKGAREIAVQQGQQQENNPGHKQASFINSPHYAGGNNKVDANTDTKPPAQQTGTVVRTDDAQQENAKKLSNQEKPGQQGMGKDKGVEGEEKKKGLRSLNRPRNVGEQGSKLKL